MRIKIYASCTMKYGEGEKEKALSVFAVVIKAERC